MRRALFLEIDGVEFSERLKDNSDDETTAYYRVDVSHVRRGGK